MQAGRASVGHPVDVATGHVYATREDISIPGKVPLKWERRYNTGILNMPPSPLGPGWTTRYFATLTKGEKEFRLLTPEGGFEIFADPQDTVERGGTVRNLGTFQEIRKRHGRYIITRWNVDTNEVERYAFHETKKGQEWPLASLEDVTGQALDLLRDNQGRLTSIRQRFEKRALQIEYTPSNRIRSISLLCPETQRQVLASYKYDDEGRLIAAYNALQYADRYQYDGNSRMAREIFKDGGIFGFKYDEKGRCVATSGIDHYDEKTLRYLDAIRWTEVTDSVGHVTRYQHLPTGQVVCEINPLGGKHSTEYDDHGRIRAKMDPNGAQIQYEYDEIGNRSVIRNSLGHKTCVLFNGDHLPTQISDPAGNVWKRLYDIKCRLVSAIDPTNQRWSYAYGDDGNLVEITDPNGSKMHLNYSHDQSVLELTDWVGNKIEQRYDAFGRVCERRNPSGAATKIRYNLLGYPLEITFADGARMACSYDAASNPVSLTDANGNTTRYRFGPCRRLMEKLDPLGNATRYEWGTEPGILQRIINSKREVYEFAYDSAQRIVREKGFDGRQIELNYDPAGHCIAYINGLNEKITYRHDAIGNIIEKALPDGTKTTFVYDALGNIIEAKSPTCKLNFVRDPLGRVMQEEQGNHVILRRHDALGRCVSLETSLGCKVAYGFNRNGNLSSISANERCEIGFRRNRYGVEAERLFQGYVTLEQRFDLLGSLSAQGLTTDNSSSRLRSETVSEEAPEFKPDKFKLWRLYRYDKKGLLNAIHDSRWGESQFNYDPAGHLTDVIKDGQVSEHFSYDSTGNMTANGETGERELVYGSGGRIEKRRNVTYSYDGNGRLIEKVENEDGRKERVWRYTWNASDQLISVETPNGNRWLYEYDPFGRRVAKKGPDKEVRFVWDGDVVLHTVDNESSASTWLFEPRSFRPLCTLQKDKVGFIISDHLGTPRELVDDVGKVIWSASYTAWGKVSVMRKGDADCPLRFQGQWFDEETGLHYNRFRYYDPECGHYLSEDPLRASGGLNLHAYVKDPINWTDPFGLTDEACLKKDAEAARDEKIEELLARGEKPAAVIGAYDPVTGQVAVGVSGSVPPRSEVPQPLVDMADQLGGLGARTSATGPVGNCAEFDAASQLIQQGSRPEDIRFTDAVRPRTGEVVPRCDNCKTMFGES